MCIKKVKPSAFSALMYQKHLDYNDEADISQEIVRYQVLMLFFY